MASFCISLFLLPGLAAASSGEAAISTSETSRAARARWLGSPDSPGPLAQELARKKFRLGAPLFFRIFKQTAAPESHLRTKGDGTDGILEIWIRQPSGRYDFFKSFKIARFSGELGPKLREGDRQAPEGFYEITADSLNPNSKYHLAMNVGYPNEYDQLLGRTGSAIMVHGNDKSIGCFAMTDAGIEEIYVLAEASLAAGRNRRIPVHSFPFPLTSENLAVASELAWYGFWSNLREGYDYFENFHVPPVVSAKKDGYVFENAFPSSLDVD